MNAHRASDEATLRARWRQLIDETLPQAAAARPDWPVRLNHCFARIILDTACGRHWREAIPAPAWRRMDVDTLARAVILAESILSDTVDLRALNRDSLTLRGRSRASKGRGAGGAGG